MNTETGKPAQTVSHAPRWRWLRAPSWFRAPIWSPQGFLVRAGLIAVVYLVMNVLGWSECTSLVCGTSPTGNVADRFVLFKGCAFAVTHFAFVLGVPILLIAAGLFALLVERSAKVQPRAVTVER